ncbi:hypothetical protein CLG96_00170 [Sphingomonas oleivorans]|uniref:Uncharacterized protein n=1 Tax=Sphingomonas oleivorans TaxID=1735121 RepID=A0A2T5G3C7_9SPHN|nr:hypothetical protein [Sphingomonas oleivorans]PTQ13735.1 hypothetical protein CLG96_00170 [Sphingomonas oleivorans]
MVEYLKVAAKNVSEGPRIFNAAPHIILQPGQSTAGAVDISEAELASMTATGWFEIGAAPPARGRGAKPREDAASA